MQNVQGSLGTGAPYYNPYHDSYTDIFFKIRGTLATIQITAWNISDSMYKPGGVSREINIQQNNELEQQGETLFELQTQLFNQRKQGIRPSEASFPLQFGANEHIEKCNLLITTFENQANLNEFKKHWHFQGIIGHIKTLKEELLACNRAFATGYAFKQ